MRWFWQRRKEYGGVDRKGRVYVKELNERQWVLDMYRRKGYIINRYSMREGK
ncbi:hypothetical protein H1D32_07810 [Anaerobacillus sp. CMMVII]|uniref:hypothetical protein n=1 Tax=Anaerobacillus sp. CMMVII TaxID=2755588 RepID=UPI0021B73567|nr:hypothetical protein [Anaerobacillus sp. CMMVII]MCT8137668.1 hypothetical protein [Anaerobacillus sp. CMMVII]